MPVHCGGDPRGPLLLLGILLAVSLLVVEYPAKCKMAYKKACLLFTWVCLFLTSLQVGKPVCYIILYSFTGGVVLYIVDCCIELMSHIVCVIFGLCWLGVCWGSTFISLRSFTLALQHRYCQFGCPRNPLLRLGHLVASVDEPGIAYNHSFLVPILGSMGSRPWFFHVGFL